MKFQLKSFHIGLVALIVIVLHISAALYFLFVPERFQPSHRVVSLYKQLVLLGPFFTESRIDYSPHLFMRYKREGVWSETRDIGKERFLYYLDNPWQVDHLAYLVYEKQLTNELVAIHQKSSFDQLQMSSDFREFNEFVLEEIIKMPVDSIHIVYGLDYHRNKAAALPLDTVFNFKYNPAAIGKAKK